MLESELGVLLRQVIIDGMTARGYDPTLLPVIRSQQPRQQGVPEGQVVFFYHVGPSRRYGSPSRKNVLNTAADAFDYTETQLWECKYIVGALAAETPALPTDPNASDLAQTVSDVLQSQDAIDTFKNNKVGILRITDVSVLWFGNDKEQQEENPTFEVTLRRTSSFTKAAGIVTEYTSDVSTI